MVDLPAVNTPQFDWAMNKMGKKAQPVPPIYQPEVPARAIYFAATHKRRDVWVGFPTVKAILANRIAPALDRPLSRQGRLQGAAHRPSDRPTDAPANLYRPRARAITVPMAASTSGIHGPAAGRCSPTGTRWRCMPRWPSSASCRGARDCQEARHLKQTFRSRSLAPSARRLVASSRTPAPLRKQPCPTTITTSSSSGVAPAAVPSRNAWRRPASGSSCSSAGNTCPARARTGTARPSSSTANTRSTRPGTDKDGEELQTRAALLGRR